MARSLAFVLALVLGAAESAAASPTVPPFCNCTIPDRITVVGTSHGVPDPLGRFEVIVRDIGGQPVANATVWLDFTNCTDTRLCLNQGTAGVLVRCDRALLEAHTDAAGRVEFDVVGGGTNTGATPGAGAGCLTVFVDGVSRRHVTVAVLDQNGAVVANGVEVTDITAWLKDLGSGVYVGRSDYSGNGSVDVTDLTLLMNALGSGNSSNGCFSAPFCP